MKIAVVSDLHVGSNSRAQDFCLAKVPDPYADENYLEQFVQYAQRNGITADYLLVCGDISCKSHVDEIALGGKIAGQIKTALKAKKLYFVPGNHDKDWSLHEKDGDSIGFWKEYSYLPLRIQGEDVSRSMSEGVGALLSPPFHAIWENDDIVVAGINSAFHDSASELNHYGYISEENLEALSVAIGKYRDDDRVKILLLHHHPVLYPEVKSKLKDFSVLQNANNLLRLVEANNFDMVIHGHRHVPVVKFMATELSTQLVYLCAGSFSVRLEPCLSGSVANTFHIIEVERRCPNSLRVQGQVKTWAFTPKDGWQPSIKERDFIDHISPYGSCKTREEIKQLAKISIVKLFENSKNVRLTSLFEQAPELQYVEKPTFDLVLDEISELMKFEIFDNSKGRILVKG